MELPEDYDATERQWYIKVKDDEYYIDEYEDAISKKKIITLSKVLYKEDILIGVVGIDIIKENN